jgi:hypothetical protein
MRFALKVRSRMFEIVGRGARGARGVGALPAFATEMREFDVPAEEAPAAMRDFAAQASPVTGERSTRRFNPVHWGQRWLLRSTGLA